MKGITFDQLKTMLKSMSNAIFKRMGVLEDRVSPPNKPIKHIYATDEKGNAKWTKAAEAIGQIDPIIITNTGDGNEPNYVCNYTADELWDIDANVIQQNTRVIDGDKQYAVRGVNKILEPLYGKVIQFTADLNAAYYDFTPPFTSMFLTLINYMGKKMLVDYTQTPRKKIDTGYAPYQRSDHGYFLGNSGDQWNQRCVIGVKDKNPHLEVSTVLNVISSDYTSLTGEHPRDENPTYSLDIDRVSVVQAIKDGSLSGVVLYYTDSHEAAVGKTAVLDHIETTDITHTYADVAFIMQPDENGKYARITLNPGELGTANVEWLQTDTIGNKKVGEGLEVVGGKLRLKPEGEYELIEEITIEEDVQYFVRNTDPDGTPYNFKKMLVDWTNPSGSEKKAGVFNFNGIPALYFMTAIETSVNGSWSKGIAEIDGNILKISGANGINGDSQLAWTNTYVYTRAFANMGHEAINYFLINIVGGKIPVGSKIKIYGVRKHA